MPGRVLRNDARKFVIGTVAVAVGAVIAFLGVTVQGGGELPLKSYTYVKAAFDEVGMLKKGQDVTQNGVRVGTVRTIEYAGGAAVVTMRLDGHREVYADARASIRSESALGRKQVGFDPGTPSKPLLGDGVIPTMQTTSASSLDDVFETFDPRTRASLQAGLSELGGGLAGHGDDLNAALQNAPGLLHGLSKISDAATSSRADLPSLLESSSTLAGRLDEQSADLAALLAQVDETFEAIAVDDGSPLRQTVAALPSTLRQTRSGLSALDQPLADLQVTMSTLRPGAAALARSMPDLRGFLEESLVPLKRVPGFSEQAEPAVSELTRTMSDARPLAPLVASALTDAAILLRGLAPYATDIGRFFSEHDLLSGQLAPGKNFFSAMLVLPGLRNLSLPDPLVETVPYPAPGGGAWSDNPVPGGAR